MKKLLIALFGGLCLMVAFDAQRADAITAQYAYKYISVNFTVTPSPVAYTPARSARPAVAAAPAPKATPAGASPRIVAFEPALFGAGLGVGTLVPQQTVAATQGNVPVSINVQADPTAQYLHIVPMTPNLNAAYGLNTYTCAFKIYAYYTNTWRVTDWVASSNGFPTWWYPTASNLSWLAEGITTSYTAYSNSGSPGQLAFNGVAKVAQTVCIDLQLNVPASTPAGSYSAPLQYTLVVTL